MTRLIFVRHGESQVTVNRVVGGPRSCVGLSDLGRQQAVKLRDRWTQSSEFTPDLVISSAYPRAKETAEIVLPAFVGRSIEVLPEFGEHDPGPRCDGLPYTEFTERFGDPDWENDPFGMTFPGGETIAEFQFRIGSAVRSLVDRLGDGTAVIFCHGGVVDTALRQSMRAAGTGVFEIYTVNTSITELLLVKPGRWRVIRYNDSAHLVGLPASTLRSLSSDESQ
jgi:probable phosphoglycerate mutase